MSRSPRSFSLTFSQTWEGKEGPFVRMIYNDKVVGHMTTGELTAKLRDLVPTAADCNAKL